MPRPKPIEITGKCTVCRKQFTTTRPHKLTCSRKCSVKRNNTPKDKR